MSFANVSHNENNGEYEFARARRVLFDSRISILEASNILADASGNSVHWYIDRNPDYNIVTNLNRPTVGHKRHSIDIICKNIEISEEEQNCCICMEEREKNDICRFTCQHSFCGTCIIDILKTQSSACCPLCREMVTNIITQKNNIQHKLQEYCL
jgi:hypothetical protein